MDEIIKNLIDRFESEANEAYTRNSFAIKEGDEGQASYQAGLHDAFNTVVIALKAIK